MNITAFMNLMVILVPFLLITAVFSRLAILELDLPAESAARIPPPADALELELILRREALELSSRPGTVMRIARREGAYDLEQVAALLREIKSRHPRETGITLLLEPDIAYQELVQVMDAVRVTAVERNGRRVNAELFPDIRIGDAPPEPIQQASDRR